MDHKGYEALQGAFRAAGIQADVSPEPDQDSHEEFVTVNTAPDLSPAVVIRAIAGARLLHRPGPGHAGFLSGPQLDPMFGGPGSITFQDMNNQN